MKNRRIFIIIAVIALFLAVLAMPHDKPKTAKGSYSDLVETSDKILDFCKSEKSKNQPAHISRTAILRHEGVIEVGIYPLNKKTEKWFRKNVADEAYIVFVEQKPGSVEATD